MGRLGNFILGLIVGGAAVYTSLKYHVVRASDGIHMIPKLSADFAETYVDIREYDFGDWSEHQLLVLAITRADKAYLLQEGAVDSLQQAAEERFLLPWRRRARP